MRALCASAPSSIANAADNRSMVLAGYVHGRIKNGTLRKADFFI